MTTAKTVGKPILATRWNCFLFKGTLAMQIMNDFLCYRIRIIIYAGGLIVKEKFSFQQSAIGSQ